MIFQHELTYPENYALIIGRDTIVDDVFGGYIVYNTFDLNLAVSREYPRDNSILYPGQGITVLFSRHWGILFRCFEDKRGIDYWWTERGVVDENVSKVLIKCFLFLPGAEGNRSLNEAVLAVLESSVLQYKLCLLESI